MSRSPLVSVVTPVYNGERFLVDAIESVLRQTYQNWEYVILDNGSTDGSPSIIDRYAGEDPRIRAYRNEETAPYIDNWNRAISLADRESRYCKVVHADDWLYDDCLAEMVALAERHPEVGVVASWIRSGDQIRARWDEAPGEVVAGRTIGRLSLLNEIPYLFGSPSALLLRGDLVTARAEFYPDVGHPLVDQHVCYELLRTSDFGYVGKALSYNRLHGDSITAAQEDVNQWYVGKLTLLQEHGSFYLSEPEQAARVTHYLGRYYRFLASQVGRGRSSEFWSYHKEALDRLGLGFDRSRLWREAVSDVPRRAKRRLLLGYSRAGEVRTSRWTGTTGNAANSGSKRPLSVALLPYQGLENPYLRLLQAGLEAAGADVHPISGIALRRVAEAAPPFDVMHLHWHHRLFVPRSGSLPRAVRQSLGALWRLHRLRRNGVCLIWTVHNLVNHERELAEWELRCCRWLARMVDKIIVHCDAAREAVVHTYKVDPDKIAVVPHGHYLEAYPDVISRPIARTEWGLRLEDRVILFFGQIRRYKGVEGLISTFSGLPGDDLRLLVAGKPKSAELAKCVGEAAAADSRVSVHTEFLDDRQLVSSICASNVVVLPYLDSLTSGAAVLAASLGRPVVAPRLGCMGEFPDDASFLYDPQDPNGLESALRASMSASSDREGQRAKAYVSSDNWEDVGRSTLEVYSAGCE
jgi:glycosyltransferase involved in cell wall biosynthesis